jgi:hypothetical protein
MLLRCLAEYFRFFQLSGIGRTRGRGAAPLGFVAACVTLAGCTATAPLAVVPQPENSGALSAAGQAGKGDLVVYSATFAATLEEGEYPAHTDYTVATTGDEVIAHVTNRTGSFDKRPATLSLASGEYHVRAQYQRGGFIVVPVTIEPGKTIILDLDGAPSVGGATDLIRLPDGTVAGWRSIRPKQ